MKIIFLDVDGVLNSEVFYVKRHEDIKGNMELLEHPYCEFDKKAVEHLNYVIEQTGAKVVISSVWRHGRTIQQLQEIFERVGFKGEIIDKTPDLRSDDCLRGNEILKWMRNNEKLLGQSYHEYENYVIFDDDSDMLYWQKDNFLQVDRWVGLTMIVAYKAIRILNRGRGMVQL